VTPGASTQVIPAGNAPPITFVSCSNGCHHGIDAEDVDGPPEIVDKCREAELSPDIVEAPHQESALIHLLLDRAKGVLEDLAAAVENVGPRRQALRHAIERVLVFDAGDSCIARAAGSRRRARRRSGTPGVASVWRQGSNRTVLYPVRRPF
jgi:hypothetical protein